jgi:P4 family phage/plasmid primase-like protien
MSGVLAYSKKNSAIKKAATSATHKLVANRQITNYFTIENHTEFLKLIKSSEPKDYYEHIPSNVPVPFFFDIEIYKDKTDYYHNPDTIINTCINQVKDSCLGQFTRMHKIVLESHAPDHKLSFHIIIRLFNHHDQEVLFANVSQLKMLYKQFKLHAFKDSSKRYLIDPSVYRDGLFRTIYSSKEGENRPLVISAASDSFNELQSFVCYHQDDYVIYSHPAQNHAEAPIEVVPFVNTPEKLDEQDTTRIKKFIQKNFYHSSKNIRDVFVDEQYNCIVVALNEKYCHFVDREHRNNNQYVVIDTFSAKQKCHNTDCNKEKHREILLEQYPSEISEIIKKVLRISQQELDLIDNAIIECKKYINENFDQNVQDVSFDSKEMIFKGNVSSSHLNQLIQGTCPECNAEHHISDNGYCLKCKKCAGVFPKNQIIPLGIGYKTLNSFWMNYNQLVNHGTINNIINIYQNGEEDFQCDIKLDNNIFKNKEITSIINKILDGHKVTMISKLLHHINKNFVYSKNLWFFFGGSIWKSDNDNIEMRKELMDLSKLFDRIRNHYEKTGGPNSTLNNDNLKVTLTKNIKSIITKFHKPGFQDDIIKGAKIYFNDDHFMNSLNSKKHLVPFTNGVYDLINNVFRKTKKEDYVNLTVNFDYKPQQHNPEVYTFLEQVLPIENVRHYVLKKMSECLNGDIPNTNFLFFIGASGANGKSQLLNLMKTTMGDFGEKVEVTLLTRKRNNANEANTEKIKLMHKRFAFLSEPEDGEKINIGLLKELTGSEEVVARGLYQDAMSFIMEAKLFLACNELPEIKGEDNALWRRIRVIEFPSKFVDDPKEPDEYPIDRSLPSRMREDLSWRQTFINILIEYYYKSVPTPSEVQAKTNEYQSENDFNSMFVHECLLKGGTGVKWQDIWAKYQEWYFEKTERQAKNKKAFKAYLETRVFKAKETPVRNIGRGWYGWDLVQSIETNEL